MPPRIAPRGDGDPSVGGDPFRRGTAHLQTSGEWDTYYIILLNAHAHEHDASPFTHVHGHGHVELCVVWIAPRFSLPSSGPDGSEERGNGALETREPSFGATVVLATAEKSGNKSTQEP